MFSRFSVLACQLFSLNNPLSRSTEIIKIALTGVALFAASLNPAMAEDWSAASNPQPTDGDILFPLPGGIDMVMRRIEVPGESFWGDATRTVRLGDPSGRVFENSQKLMIGGSFHTDNNEWAIYLGKYEVTKAQYAFVMGQGNLENGISRLTEVSGNPEDKKLLSQNLAARKKALSKPLSWISWFDYQEFLEVLNASCFASPLCLEKLPRVSNVPGYFRLPTEIEWEYTARGGVETLFHSGRSSFEKSAPFKSSDWEQYAWASPKSRSNSTSIGRFKPTFGLHDMHGNVQELVLEPFYPELRQGKPGALSARGGNFLMGGESLRSSLRSEVAIYEWSDGIMKIAKSPTTGIRLALGSAVVVSKEYRDRILQEYETYRGQVQRAMPAGGSLTDGLIRAGDPLSRAEDLLDTLTTQPENANSLVEQAKEQLYLVRRTLDSTALAAALESIRLGLATLSEFKRSSTNRSELMNMLPTLEKLAVNSEKFSNRLAKTTNDIESLESSIDRLSTNYSEHVEKINSYGQQISERALGNAKGLFANQSEVSIFQILERHVEIVNGGTSIPSDWRQELETAFGTN